MIYTSTLKKNYLQKKKKKKNKKLIKMRQKWIERRQFTVSFLVPVLSVVEKCHNNDIIC